MQRDAGYKLCVSPAAHDTPQCEELEGGRQRMESPVMGNYHAGFGREGACFLPDILGVAAHSYLSDKG